MVLNTLLAVVNGIADVVIEGISKFDGIGLAWVNDTEVVRLGIDVTNDNDAVVGVADVVVPIISIMPPSFFSSFSFCNSHFDNIMKISSTISFVKA